MLQRKLGKSTRPPIFHMVPANTEDNTNELIEMSKSTFVEIMKRLPSGNTILKIEDTTSQTEFAPTSIETESTPYDQRRRYIPHVKPHDYWIHQLIELDTSKSEVTTETTTWCTNAK